MPLVKLLGKLPDDDTGDNGLDELYQDLLKDTDKSSGHLVVGVVRCATYNTDIDRHGAKQPCPRFLKIEAVLPEDQPLIRAILERAKAHRTGQPPALDEFLDVLSKRLCDEQAGTYRRALLDRQEEAIFEEDDIPV